MALIRRLYSLKLKPGGSVQQHINDIVECCQQLMDRGKEIADEDRAFLLLSSLTAEFNILLSSLDAVENLTFSFCVSRLLEEELRLRVTMETHFSVQWRNPRGAPAKVSQRDDGGGSLQLEPDDSVFPVVCRVRKKKCFICQSSDYMKNACPQ